MFVDLHLHLLPALDDGAHTLEDSLAMAKGLVAAGYGRAAVSPHLRPGRFENRAAGIAEAVEATQAALDAAGVTLKLERGAEHYLCPEVVAEVLAGGGQALGGGRYTLFEAPLQGPVPAIQEVLFQLRVAGRRVIMAHPERCELFEDLKLMQSLREAETVFQLDLGSLAGAYGPSAKKLARRNLKAGLYQVAGSDLHRPKQSLELLPLWQTALRERVSEAQVETLLQENPQTVLDGGLLP